MAAYTVMSGTSQPTFSQIEKEYYDSSAQDRSASIALPAPSDGPSHGGGSGSPREASVADLQHAVTAAGPSTLPWGPVPSQRPRGGYSVAQLVQEPDSLVCIQEPAGSQEPAADLDGTQLEVEAEPEPSAAGAAPPESTNKKSLMTSKYWPPKKYVELLLQILVCVVPSVLLHVRYCCIENYILMDDKDLLNDDQLC